MADIISIDDKLQLTKEKKADLVRKRKISAVQKVFQCTHCNFKCEKCGTQISMPDEGEQTEDRDPRVPYRFCASCSEEYIDYIERLKGGGDPDCYWHNSAWLGLWQAWTEYQSSIDSYLKSKEFIQLMNELKQTTPDR
ncbi:hypothetical protein ACFLZL_03745 [Thermodesulfobacteriota bacterium]